MSGLHEDLNRQEAEAMPSTRSFLWVMNVVPLLIAALTAWQGLVILPVILVSITLLVDLAALFAPGALATLNRWWFRLSLLLGMIMTPLVMGLIFFLVLTPIALARRLLVRDPLQLRFDHDASSYWVDRDADEPSTHLDQQF